MGGNALKDFPTGRLNKKEFIEAFDNIKEKFSSVILDCVPYVSEKENFGDLDIIVEMESINKFYERNKVENISELSEQFSEFLTENFNCRQTYFSFPVISFEYRKNKDDHLGFQVDLIHIPKEKYNFSLNYFSYNDLGNLIGVLYRNMGLRFGHYGLNKEVYHPHLETTKLADINITNDFDKALDFIGLDPIRFKKGFKNINEVFEYVSSSKYFNPDVYLLDVGINDYKSRRRNAQRPTYNKFLSWIKENKKNLTHFDIKSINIDYLINNYFDENYIIKIKKINESFDNRALQKERIKGEKINEWTGLTHQALGILTSSFKKRFSDENELIKYISEKTDEDLKIDFIELKSNIDFSGIIGDPKTNPAPIDIKNKEKVRIKKEKRGNL